MIRSNWLENLVKVLIPLAVIPASSAITPKAAALEFLIDFEGLQDNEQILNYYNGGLGSLGSGPGPEFGITFNIGSLVVKEGSFLENPPSPVTAAVFTTAQGMILNSTEGLIDEFSFFYSSKNSDGKVTVYDGLGATGNILMSVPLEPLDSGGSPGDPFRIWEQVDVSFNGVAKSIQFSSIALGLAVDNITVNSIPEPLTILGSATAVGFGAFFKRHLSKQQPPGEDGE